MRKLVFILIAFIAAVTFIRALDNQSPGSVVSVDRIPVEIPGGTISVEQGF